MTRLQTLGLFFLLTLSILSQADAATMTWLNTSVSVPETLVFSRDGKILPVRVTSDKIGGFGFFPREDIEWGLNCIFAFGIGMLSAMILFAPSSVTGFETPLLTFDRGANFTTVRRVVARRAG